METDEQRPADDAPRPDGEDRNAPTYEDYDVAYGLKQAKKAVAGVKADQLTDPDHGTDPDDEAVLSAIEDAEAALDKAIVAQAKDGRPDAEQKSAPRDPATPKRAFSSLLEQPPAHKAEFQVRLDAGEDSNVANFVGYASTTGVAYSVRDWLGEYQETILPGAFAKTLREQGNVPLLFNHDGIPLASTASGTSRLSEDKIGLRNEADLDRRDALTNSVCIQLQRGVLDKMSFSFRAVKESWNDSYDERGVNEAALYDSSIVTYPANPTTTADLQESMRSALGREGVGLMWSMRSALPVFVESRALPEAGEDVLEQALRALVHADEQLCKRFGPQGRARTFVTARAMLEVRQGKVLSTSNQALLESALSALSAAGNQHQGLAQSHDTARSAVQGVLDSAAPAQGATDGEDQNQGATVLPQDGAGIRTVPPGVLAARRQLERLRSGR